MLNNEGLVIEDLRKEGCENAAPSNVCVLGATGSIGLSTLDISANTNLINLNVQRNDLVTIDVSTLRQLAILDCSKNNLSTLDISNNIRLNEFNCIKRS